MSLSKFIVLGNYTTNLKVFSDDKSLDEFKIIPIKISDLNPGKTKKFTENLQLIQSQTQDYLNRIHKKELPLNENTYLSSRDLPDSVLSSAYKEISYTNAQRIYKKFLVEQYDQGHELKVGEFDINLIHHNFSDLFLDERVFNIIFQNTKLHKFNHAPTDILTNFKPSKKLHTHEIILEFKLPIFEEKKHRLQKIRIPLHGFKWLYDHLYHKKDKFEHHNIITFTFKGDDIFVNFFFKRKFKYNFKSGKENSKYRDIEYWKKQGLSVKKASEKVRKYLSNEFYSNKKGHHTCTLSEIIRRATHGVQEAQEYLVRPQRVELVKEETETLFNKQCNNCQKYQLKLKHKNEQKQLCQECNIHFWIYEKLNEEERQKILYDQNIYRVCRNCKPFVKTGHCEHNPKINCPKIQEKLIEHLKSKHKTDYDVYNGNRLCEPSQCQKFQNLLKQQAQEEPIKCGLNKEDCEHLHHKLSELRKAEKKYDEWMIKNTKPEHILLKNKVKKQRQAVLLLFDLKHKQKSMTWKEKENYKEGKIKYIYHPELGTGEKVLISEAEEDVNYILEKFKDNEYIEKFIDDPKFLKVNNNISDIKKYIVKFCKEKKIPNAENFIVALKKNKINLNYNSVLKRVSNSSKAHQLNEPLEPLAHELLKQHFPFKSFNEVVVDSDRCSDPFKLRKPLLKEFKRNGVVISRFNGYYQCKSCGSKDFTIYDGIRKCNCCEESEDLTQLGSYTITKYTGRRTRYKEFSKNLLDKSGSNTDA